MSMLMNHYLATDELAARLGLGAELRASLGQNYERWDGKGPMGLKGGEICISSRLVNLADVVELFHRFGGIEAAIEVARKRSGGQFDPRLVRLFCDEAEGLLGDLDAATGWDEVIAAEPALEVQLSDEEFEDALAAIGDFADLKSPWTIGHSHAVGELADEAGRLYGLPEDDVTLLRRAALVHDIGRLGVSNAIWDKRGTLTQSEVERLRLHPYLTERMLAFSPLLAPLGAIAVQHHERLDGSGYPRALSGDAIMPAGRILAAADVYQTMTEMRPHRSARTLQAAAAGLRAMVAAGRIDGDGGSMRPRERAGARTSSWS